MRRALSTASLGLLRAGTGAAGDVLIDQGVVIDEISDSVSFFDSDQLSFSISDELTMIEISAKNTNVQIDQSGDKLNAD